MTVLKVDIVDMRLVFCVDRLDPVIVEKVERPVCRLMKFKLMTVLKVDIVDWRLVFCVDKFDPVIVEKVDKPV
jgi:hypothetical protein